MDVPTAVRQARERASLTGRELGRRVGYSEQMISAIETGAKRLAPDVAPSMARILDDPDLYLALAAETAGGVFVPVILDGPRVDLHRLSTGTKASEEFAEAIRAIAQCRALINCRCPEDLDEAGRAQVREVLHQVAEAVTAGGNTLRVMCRTYGVSPAGIWREHVAELVAKGLAAPERRREVKRFARSA